MFFNLSKSISDNSKKKTSGRLRQLLAKIKPNTSAKGEPTSDTPQSELNHEPIITIDQIKHEHFSNLKNAQRYWNICIASLPLDYFIMRIGYPSRDPIATLHALQALNLLMIALALASIGGERLSTLSFSFYDLRSRFTGTKWGSIATLIFLAVISTWELIAHALSAGGYALIMLAAALILALPSLIKNATEQRQQRLSRERDSLLVLHDLNGIVFWIYILPLLAGRMVSIVAAFQASLYEPNNLDLLLNYAALSLFLMITQPPTRNHFIASCRHCGQWRSSAHQPATPCPNCSRTPTHLSHP